MSSDDSSDSVKHAVFSDAGDPGARSSDTTAKLTLRDSAAGDALDVARLHSESWQTAYRGILTDRYLDEIVPEEHRLRWRDLLEGAPVRGE